MTQQQTALELSLVSRTFVFSVNAQVVEIKKKFVLRSQDSPPLEGVRGFKLMEDC